MIFLVDQEGKNTLESLIDIALKTGGIKNLSHANKIIASVKIIPPQKKGNEDHKGEQNLHPSVKDAD